MAVPAACPAERPPGAACIATHAASSSHRRAFAAMPVAVFAMGPRRDEEERFQRSRL